MVARRLVEKGVGVGEGSYNLTVAFLTAMKYSLEIYYQGEVIEHREQSEAFPLFLPGEQVYIEFENSNYSEEYGHWWIVRKRKHLLFNPSLNLQKLMIYCEPDPLQGETLID